MLSIAIMKEANYFLKFLEKNLAYQQDTSKLAPFYFMEKFRTNNNSPKKHTAWKPQHQK